MRIASAVPTEPMVYFVRADTGEIKIGIAENPESRLSSLQTGSPVRLSLLAAIPGGIERERELHRRFSAHRLHGEWFAADILKGVEELVQADDSHALCRSCHAARPAELFVEGSDVCRDCAETTARDIVTLLVDLEINEQEIRSAEHRIARFRHQSEEALQGLLAAEESWSPADRLRVRELLGEKTAELDVALAEAAAKREAQEAAEAELLREFEAARAR